MNENHYLHYCHRCGRVYVVMAESQDQYTRFVSQSSSGCKIRPYSEHYSGSYPIFYLCREPESDLPDTKNRDEHGRNLHRGKKKVKEKVSLSKKSSIHNGVKRWKKKNGI
jgi:hypothetical protein